MNKQEKAILIGTLLGDSSLILDRDCVNPYFKCCHGPLQKEYCKSKGEQLKTINPKFKHYIRKKADKRTGKFYESYILESGNKPYLLDIFNIIYNENKIKIISKEILNYFDESSLAYMFMDDGYKTSHSIVICTDSFSIECLTLLVSFLKEKYDLEFNIIGKNRLYLKAKSYLKFKELIVPFVHSSMMYKFPK